MKKPNFFIIGAPKCGTTALSQYLREHKDIFFCEPKEPRFFSTDFPEKHRRISSLEIYERLFDNANEYKAVGEGSAYYLYSNTAVPKIIKYNPEAKFIILVRNPLTLAKSWHAHLIHNGYENIINFDKALKAERNGRYNFSSLRYDEIADWSSRVHWVQRYVKSSHLLIHNVDEQPMSEIYTKTLQFLDVDNDNREYFPIINKGKSTSTFRRLLFNVHRIRRKLGITM